MKIKNFHSKTPIKKLIKKDRRILEDSPRRPIILRKNPDFLRISRPLLFFFHKTVDSRSFFRKSSKPLCDFFAKNP